MVEAANEKLSAVEEKINEQEQMIRIRTQKINDYWDWDEEQQCTERDEQG